MPTGNPRLTKLAMALTVFVLIPLALVLYTLYDNRNFGLISFILVILMLIPFLVRYEMKKPQAREWIPLVVMAALAAVGRLAFTPLPFFKPMSAIIIITAMVFGAEAGFLTGALAALASNLFFGQGPWTPWQMFSWGLVGMVAGILSRHGLLNKKWQLCVYGLLSGFLYGWIMNIWAATTYMMMNSGWESFLILYISSFPVDLIHGISTVIFLLLIHKSWVAKLRRVKLKFGILAENSSL